MGTELMTKSRVTRTQAKITVVENTVLQQLKSQVAYSGSFCATAKDTYLLMCVLVSMCMITYFSLKMKFLWLNRHHFLRT